MNLAELESKGGFVANTPLKTSVTWTRETADGEVSDTFDIFIKRKSAGSMNRIRAEADKKDYFAKLISEFVLLGDKADQQISYEKALLLDDGLQLVFMKEINKLFEDKANPKNSAPPKKSGTN